MICIIMTTGYAQNVIMKNAQNVLIVQMIAVKTYLENKINTITYF